MNRSEFLKIVGFGTAAAVTAPSMLTKKSEPVPPAPLLTGLGGTQNGDIVRWTGNGGDMQFEYGVVHKMNGETRIVTNLETGKVLGIPDAKLQQLAHLRGSDL